MNKPKVLIFNVGFYPSVRYGGPPRSLTNLVRATENQFSYHIVTSDRDLGCTEPYESIVIGDWSQFSKSRILYLKEGKLGKKKVSAIIQKIAPDLIYLNSFWDRQYSMQPLFAKIFGNVNAPILVAPRGEFNKSALAVKWLRKWLFLKTFGKIIGRSQGIFWQATNEIEHSQLSQFTNGSDRVFQAGNIPSIIDVDECRPPVGERLKVATVGRVAVVKNIDYAIRALRGVKSPVDFDIIGPLEDPAYENVCNQEIDQLPPHINVKFRGPMAHEEILKQLTSTHLLFSPTQGENFGHSIVEALQSGCPVLISDKTPWHQLEEGRAGWDLSLSNPQAFADKIDWLFEHKDQFADWSRGARQYATNNIIKNIPSTRDHLEMFQKVIATKALHEANLT